MKRRHLLMVVGFVGVLVGVHVIYPIPDLLRRMLAPSPRSVASPLLEDAKTKSDAAIQAHIDPIRSFFDDSKKNTRKFAEVALGLASKWELLKDQVPFTQGGRHEKYIRGQFEEMVISAKQLEDVISAAVADYLAEVRNIENLMLVSLRADISGFPDTYPLATLDVAQLKMKFEEAIRRAIDATGTQLKADVSSQIVSIVVAETLAQVAVRLGVSAGIIAAGGALSSATFGIGFVVGVIIDQIVAWVWDWWADPTGDLAADLDKKLDEMKLMICEGDARVKGLSQRLRDLANERAMIRQIAIMDLLTQKDGSK